MSNCTEADLLATRRATRSTTEKLRALAKKKAFSCHYCKYSSNDREKLLQHLISNHTGNRPFGCHICGFRTLHHQSFKKHLRTHSEVEHYECDECDFRTSRSYALEQHMKSHMKDKPYVCDQCEFTTTQQNALLSHIRTHTGEKQYICDMCDTVCTSLRSLTENKRGCRLCAIHSCTSFAMTTVHLCVHCHKSCIERWTYRRATIHFALPLRINYNYVNGVLTCKCCMRVFKAKIGYISHVRAYHRQKKRLAWEQTQKALKGQYRIKGNEWLKL